MTHRSQFPKTRAAAKLRCFVAVGLLASCCAGSVGDAFAQAGGAAAGSMSSPGVQSGINAGVIATPGDLATPSPGASAAPTANPSMLYPSEDFKLSQGDLIAVRVFLQAEYSATVRVDQNGAVKLPFIGTVPVSGLSVREAQSLIADRLRTGQFYRDPEVIIQVIDTVNGSVIITGEVHMVVPVSTERTLREVLLIAGGLPANASHTVKIVRPGVAEPIEVNLGTDLAASAAGNIPIRPRDIIQISRASLVYVLGAFPHQGAVPLDQSTPLTLLQLAALSGGINYEGKFEDLRLIRTVGSERKEVRVDIKKVRDGKAVDPILQANDIIFLPTNSMKALAKSLGVGGILGIVSLLYTIQHY